MNILWIRKDGAWRLLLDGTDTGYVVHSKPGHAWVIWPDSLTWTMGMRTVKEAKAEAERLAQRGLDKPGDV